MSSRFASGAMRAVVRDIHDRNGLPDICLSPDFYPRWDMGQ
jgi:hypothetical protein